MYPSRVCVRVLKYLADMLGGYPVKNYRHASSLGSLCDHAVCDGDRVHDGWRCG